jgi:FkbM family methyltransferase
VSDEPRPLPLPLRALAATGLAGRPRGRAAAVRIAARLLDSSRPYRTPDGFLLRVDGEDPIMQTTMALGVFDPSVRAAIARFARPGSVAVDAGAHIGFVSMLLARAVGESGQVESFECDPRIVGRLREHVSLNGLEGRIAVNEAAVWDADGEQLELKLAAIPGLSYVNSGMWDPVGTSPVQTVTLDAHLRRGGIAPEELSFIKLDVEGAEPQALEGMRETLAATSAPLLVEFQEWALQDDLARHDHLIQVMSGHGFSPFTPTIRADGALELRPGVFLSEGEDVLFLKPSHVAE